MPIFDAVLSGLTTVTIDGDAAGNSLGSAVSSAGDVNGDGFDDVVIGSPGNSLTSSSVAVISGFDGTQLFVSNPGFSYVYDSLGKAVSGAGDVNGDGFDDVIAGGRNGYGDSIVVLSGSDGAVLEGFSALFRDQYFSGAFSGIADVNGDDFDDYIIGMEGGQSYTGQGSSGYTPFPAEVIVFSGIGGRFDELFSVSSFADRFGEAISNAGDVNGDGIEDFIIGAHGDDVAGLDTGSAFVFSGADGATLFSFHGDNEGDQFGFSVSDAGDVNGDGFDDVIVGDRGDFINGSFSGDVRVLSGYDGTTLFSFSGDGAGDNFGITVSDAGDVNGDGFADFIVGAPGADNNGTDTGSARIFSGIDGSVMFTFNGDSTGDLFGQSVSDAGDVNGDGFADVIVGAPGDDNNGTDSGSARLFTSVGTGRLDSSRIYAEGTTEVVLDDDVAIADAVMDSLNGGDGDYNGASLNIMRQGGGNSDDLFSFTAMASVLVKGSRLEAGGNIIATFNVVDGVLNIHFTHNNGSVPTTALVNEIIQAVAYQNANLTLLSGEQESLPLQWVFSDGTDDLSDIINIIHLGTDGQILTGTSHDDVFSALISDEGYNGLDGVDTVELSSSAAGVTVNLNLTGPQATGGFGALTISNIENLIGGGGADRFIGRTNGNVLEGGDNADQLFGIGGDDTLNGGGGNDIALGGAGTDKLFGGDGDDKLRGGAGDDKLIGGDGNDILTGDVGRDQLWGESGADFFVFRDVAETGLVYADRDIIRDFNQSDGDKIDLSGIDAITGGGDDAFIFLGTVPNTSPGTLFTHTAGELFAANTAGGQTVVWGDVDGDGMRDFTFVLDGVQALTSGDFIL